MKLTHKLFHRMTNRSCKLQGCSLIYTGMAKDVDVPVLSLTLGRVGPQDPHSVATEWPPLFLGYAASQRSMSLGALGLAGAVGAEQSDLV